MIRLFTIGCALLFATTASASDLSAASNEQLVASLVQLDSQSPGVSAMGDFGTFMGEDKPSRMTVGVVGTPTLSVAPAMRELVRRGVAALPDLMKHLDDPTATKVVVGDGDFFMWEQYAGEYDFRSKDGSKPKCDLACEQSGKATDFSGSYTVKIGDICYVLIGQIVDRNFLAVRYQPTAGLIVNSPIMNSWLAERTREDWSDLTPATHRALLLNDIRRGKDDIFVEPALIRLRFYYPKAYAALAGIDAKKRKKFEADEKDGSVTY